MFIPQHCISAARPLSWTRRDALWRGWFVKVLVFLCHGQGFIVGKCISVVHITLVLQARFQSLASRVLPKLVFLCPVHTQ